MIKSISQAINAPKIEPKWHPIYKIHSLLMDGEYVEAVCRIYEYGYRVFFFEYNLFLNEYCASPTLKNALWDISFEVFTSPVYSQVWMGLNDLPKEKPRKSKKYEWYDNLVLGQNY